MSIGLARTYRSAVRLARNAAIDLRYGGFLGGSATSSHLLRGSYETVNSDYKVLSQILPPALRADDMVVDVGCGRGRVINWLLHRGYRNRIVGIEINPEVAEQTRRRLHRYPNVEIRAGNALDCLPPHASLCYLFNPFDRALMNQFRERVLALPESARILYYAPTCLDVFEADPRFRITRGEVDVRHLSHSEDRHRRYALIERAI
jgi:SAM-dependent methyltransferase